MKNNKNIQLAVGAVVIALVGFYIGLHYGKSNVAGLEQAVRGGGQFSGLTGGARRGGAAGGLVAGEVVSKDDSSVIIKSRDGGSKIVLYSAATQVMKSAQGSIADVAAGEQVTVIGTANADGSITAQSIQLRPASSTFQGSVGSRFPATQ